MTTYLTVITTILVITQIIRLAQNSIELHRRNEMIKNQLVGIEDITQRDLDNQWKAYRLMIEYFESKQEAHDGTA